MPLTSLPPARPAVPQFFLPESKSLHEKKKKKKTFPFYSFGWFWFWGWFLFFVCLVFLIIIFKCMKILMTCKLPKRMTNFLAWLGLKKLTRLLFSAVWLLQFLITYLLGEKQKQKLKKKTNHDYTLFLMILTRKDFFFFLEHFVKNKPQKKKKEVLHPKAKISKLIYFANENSFLIELHVAIFECFLAPSAVVSPNLHHLKLHLLYPPAFSAFAPSW